MLRGGTQEEEERVRMEELQKQLDALQLQQNRTGGGRKRSAEQATLNPLDSSDNLVASIAHLAAD